MPRSRHNQKGRPPLLEVSSGNASVDIPKISSSANSSLQHLFSDIDLPVVTIVNVVVEYEEWGSAGLNYEVPMPFVRNFSPSAPSVVRKLLL